MWEPEPQWRPLGAGRGALTAGVWSVDQGGRRWIVKRVRVPGPDDPPETRDLAAPAYWHREVDAALELRPTAGLRAPEVGRVDEDPEGCTIWTERVAREGVTSLFAARALGRFAAAPMPDRPWLARGLLRSRLAAVEARGGWQTLSRTPAADLAERLWSDREQVLDRCDALPQLPAHGDAVPANLLRPEGGAVVAVDWGSVGFAPAGTDLGYFALSCREGFDVLLEAYLEGLGPGVARDDVAFGARVMAVYTVLGHAEWALARAASGSGSLEATYRHPSVAPHLRALQRRLPEIEALVVSGGRGG